MHSKRLLRKVIVSASVVAAMIGALPQPASADFLSKKDKITIGEKQYQDPEWYKNFEARTDSLFAKLKKLEKLEKGFPTLKRKVINIDSLLLNIVKASSAIDVLHLDIMTEFKVLADRNKLELKEVFKAIQKLHDGYVELILSYSDDAIKLWERKEELNGDDISKIRKLIDILDNLHKRYGVSDEKLLDRLKTLLAREIDRKYP